MRYTAAIHMTDVMDKIAIYATVFIHDDFGAPVRQVLAYHDSIPGVGEDDFGEWLKDGLIALVETL